MHLKNYSFITINDVVQLSPGYDLINTSIAIGINKVKEQIALPINGKKSNLTYKDLVTYYGHMKLGLSMKVIEQILQRFRDVIPLWREMIESSFLSAKLKQDYNLILDKRIRTLKLL